MAGKIDWTPDLIAQICDEVSSGRSIVEITAEDWCPSQPSVYRRMASDKDFARQMADARAAQQEFEADHCVAMADAATAEDWQVVKMRIWARQWRAAKLAPKKYGDKLAIGGDEDAPPVKVAAQIDYTQLSTAALKELEGVLAKDDPSADD